MLVLTKVSVFILLHFALHVHGNEKYGYKFIEKQNLNRSFTVDYDKGVFVKDGKPFRYVAGGIHYFRMLPHYWDDRLAKAKACGLDAVELYIPWNFHQPCPHRYDFKGQRDIEKFILLAQKHDLLVIVRGFPYCDTEWDMGGLPYWLLSSRISDHSNNPIKLRTDDPRFIAHVFNWFSVLLPKLKPLLYENGGPIIMVQIENEYGSIGNDKTYLNVLYNIMRKYLGENVVYFTTDGNSVKDLAGGRVNGTLQTCDFGSGGTANASFAALVKTLPKGPHVNSEFYTGWLDHWGELHHRVSSTRIVNSLDSILQFNASVNFYMFYGGTNFEYWAGSNSGNRQITTSYDYDSPLNEAGDTTEKYFAIQKSIATYKSIEKISVAKNSMKMKYGPIEMKNIGNIFQYLNDVSELVKSPDPMSYEDLGRLGGYVLYETQLPNSIKNGQVTLLLSNGVKDFAQVFLNREIIAGVINYEEKMFNFTVPYSNDPVTLSLLVRSKGRVCYGAGIFDIKGIYGDVYLVSNNEKYGLKDWTIYPIDLDDFFTSNPSLIQSRSQYLKVKSSPWKALLPSFYVGKLPVSRFHDTFIDMSDGGWISGYVIVNGFNLGYYEPKSGPQITLYTPLPGIHKESGTNKKSINVLIFETEPKYETSNVFLTDTPNIG